MKLKLQQIVEGREPLHRLATEKFPAKISYRIQRNLRALEPDAKAYLDTKDNLIREKYGVKLEGENGIGNYQVPPENIKAFVEEINNLLNEEVEVDITPIDLDHLSTISPMDLMKIEWMFNPPAGELIQPTPKKPRKRS